MARKYVRKGFSNLTLRKTVRALKAGIAFFTALLKSGEKVPVSISAGNEKIGHVWNVSNAPIITCKNCKACIRFCYAIRDIFRHGYNYLKNAVLIARCKNTALFLYDRDEYFRQIDSFLSSLPETEIHLFRWHVAGEIVDYDHFSRMVEIARKHPDFYFWSYTKMHTIVNMYIAKNGMLPDNFTMMFSQWDDEIIYNPYNLPVFHSMPAEKVSGKNWICPGNCDICKPEKRGCIGGENTDCAIH